MKTLTQTLKLTSLATLTALIFSCANNRSVIPDNQSDKTTGTTSDTVSGTSSAPAPKASPSTHYDQSLGKHGNNNPENP